MKVRDKEWFKKKVEDIKFCGYVFGEGVREVAQRFGLNPQEIVKLDSNENLFAPKDALTKIIQEVLENFDPRIYPQEEMQELVEEIGKYLDIRADYIAIGNGSDELLERIARFILEKGDQAISVTPTFSMYKHATVLQRAEYVEVPLRQDFSLDVEAILTKVTLRSRVLFLCSPNNPTANRFKKEDILTLIEEFPGIVVVDEAYAEFSEDTLVPLTRKFDNLVILRTFSKAFGIAGLRLGYCIANPEITQILSKNVGLPYPVNTLALKVGAKILEKRSIIYRAIERLKAERDKLIKKIRDIEGAYAFDSETNFVLFKTEKPLDEVYQGLLRRGIIVKKLGDILKFSNCFRATVGLPEMNNNLVKALEAICSKNS
ncbi:histidinol-phosphate transaminase [Candidatus Bathyarchaeota archaeon]|nr:histidinol-phosphate transaminase [Candidatus Bathyarchaeota archaeon]